MKIFFSKKRLLALAAACTILFGTFSFPAAATNKKIQEACNGVVRVACVVSKSANVTNFSTGSGFAVGKAGQPASLFVTNYHVIAANPEAVSIVLNSLADQQSTIPAKVVAGSQETDIAILQTDQPIPNRTPLPLESAKGLEVTQQVYALGFPGTADSETDQGSDLPSTPDEVTVTSGTVTKKQAVIKSTSYVQIDATVNHGNSGGPLMTEDGFVVGINSRISLNADKTQAAGTNYSIYIDYIMDILDKNNIPYDRGEATGREPSSSGSQEPSPSASAPQTPVPATSSPQAPLPAGPAPAQPQASAQPAASAPAAPESGSGGVSYMTIAGIAGVIGLVIAYFRRKKKPGTPAAAPAAAAPAPPQPFPTVPAVPSARKIVGAGGIFSGTSFPVSGPVLLGRDPHRCSIVYPADAPGISSAHCEVRVSGSGLILTDLGSSYGTFLADGRKLTAHQPVELAPGSSFYLASRENSFQVE